jgi:hypothetical protein
MIVRAEGSTDFHIHAESSLEADVLRYVLKSLVLFSDSSTPLQVRDANRHFVDLVPIRSDRLLDSDTRKELQKQLAECQTQT